MENRKLKNLHFLIVGLGLMGGAFADAFSSLPGARVSAYDTNEEVLERALSENKIQAGYSDARVVEAARDADVIVVCLYPNLTVEFIRKYMKDFKSGALVTDISGIKAGVIEPISACVREDVNYISGHPMAGSEKEGYGGADKAIFIDKNYILVPEGTNSEESMDLMRALIEEIGFTNIVETTAAAHDEKIAYTSQLCHVIASALVYGENDLEITDFEGGSFGDLTRIAMINAPMWTELFIENKQALVQKIDSFMESMDMFREQIKDARNEELEESLGEVRQKRVKMEIDRINKHRRGKHAD